MYAVKIFVGAGVDPSSVRYRLHDCGVADIRQSGHVLRAVVYESSKESADSCLRGALETGIIYDFDYFQIERPAYFEPSSSITPDTVREKLAQADFRISKPRSFTDHQLHTLISATQNPANPVLRAIMPFPLADFTKSARNLTMRVARGQESSHAARNELEQGYRHDTGVFNRALYNIPVMHGVGKIDIGHHMKGITPFLHSDISIPRPFYLCRVGALATGYMEEQVVLQATPEEKKIMRKAMSETDGAEWVSLLRRRGMTKRMSLGTVYMLISGLNNDGTLHFSAPVPERGADSGFFKTWGDFNNEYKPL